MRKLFTSLLLLAAFSACSGGSGWNGRNWMSVVPDETPASMMSIPGAHDACTAGVDEGYAYFRTQTLDIKGLWDAGVRSFDIRPTSRGDHLGVFHQKADTHVSFDGVVKTLASCLKENPSEFAIVIFRHEDDADLSDNFGNLMGAYLHSGLPEGLAIGFRDDLTLGELRGHILFLSRSRYEGGIVGGMIEGWPDAAEIVNASGERSPLEVQDYYEPEGKEDKLAAIAGTYEKCRESAVWTINHCSAYVASGYGENSFNVNSDAADMVASGSGKAGIMVMDFAGTEDFGEWHVSGIRLVDAVIDNNFKIRKRI